MIPGNRGWAPGDNQESAGGSMSAEGESRWELA